MVVTRTILHTATIKEGKQDFYTKSIYPFNIRVAADEGHCSLHHFCMHKMQRKKNKANDLEQTLTLLNLNQIEPHFFSKNSANPTNGKLGKKI